MHYLPDFTGRLIRVTDERWKHILERAEMVGLQDTIAKTLLTPLEVVQSVTDEAAWLYYRYCPRTIVGAKFLCVVVKRGDDAFMLTAYLTDRIKKGLRIWPRRA
jgi:hypothetical protein